MEVLASLLVIEYSAFDNVLGALLAPSLSPRESVICERGCPTQPSFTVSLSHVMDHALIADQPDDPVGRKDECYPGTSRGAYQEARNYGSSYKQSRCLQVRITGPYWRELSRPPCRYVDWRCWNPLCRPGKRSSHEPINSNCVERRKIFAASENLLPGSIQKHFAKNFSPGPRPIFPRQK